jgi:hypothetical protein
MRTIELNLCAVHFSVLHYSSSGCCLHVERTLMGGGCVAEIWMREKFFCRLNWGFVFRASVLTEVELN